MGFSDIHYWWYLLAYLYEHYKLPPNFQQALDQSLNYFHSYSWLLWFACSFILIVCSGICKKLGRGFLREVTMLPISLRIQKRVFSIIGAVCLIIFLIPLFWYLALVLMSSIWYQETFIALELTKKFLTAYGLGWLLGLFVSMFVKNYISKNIEAEFSKALDVMRKGKDTHRLSDIREMESNDSKDFNPIDYFKEGSIFIGLDQDDEPIYIPLDFFNSTHLQVMGATGSGKDVVMQTVISQAVMQGVTFGMIDPKKNGDEWQPSVLMKMCANYNVPFTVIDLNASEPQINIFDSLQEKDLKEILIAGFGIMDTGKPSDFYQVKNRRAAREAAKFAGQVNSFSELIQKLEAAHPDMREMAPGFFEKLEEISDVESIQAKQGIDLKSVINGGGVFYIISSTKDTDIKLITKLLILRMAQICEQRDSMDPNRRHFKLAVNECRFFITRPVLDTLPVIRDKRMTFCFMSQAPADLRDVGQDLNPQVCYSTIFNNCNLKLVYRLNEAKDRDDMAKLSGEKISMRETKKLEATEGFGESVDTDSRQVMETQDSYISKNVFATLQNRVGILYGYGLAKICFTSPIKVEKIRYELECFESVKAKNDAEKSKSNDSGNPNSIEISIPQNEDEGMMIVLPKETIFEESKEQEAMDLSSELHVIDHEHKEIQLEK